MPMLYVEKAMASSMAAADDIHDAVLKNGTVFNTGVLRRFDNRYGVVRDAVLRGDVGEPRAAIHYARSSLMHGHIHSIDTLSWLLGDPVIRSVRGEIDPRDYVIEGDHIPYDPIATYELEFRERCPRMVDSRGGMGVRDHRDRGDHPVAEQRGRCIVAAGAAR